MATDADPTGELTEAAATEPHTNVDVVDFDSESDGAEVGHPDSTARRSRRLTSAVSLAIIFGFLALAVLGGLTGWLGIRAHQARHAIQQRELFLEVARQGAINLTTIDWHQADGDIQRILSSSTGAFYDDFAQKSQPFVDVLKKTQSTTVGTITEAGVESETPQDAQVLVAVSVKTSSSISREPEQRSWRMRISVQKTGMDAKVSNVEFVP